MDSAAIVLKNIRRDIPAIKPLAVKVICLQRRLLDAVQHYQELVSNPSNDEELLKSLLQEIMLVDSHQREELNLVREAERNYSSHSSSEISNSLYCTEELSKESTPVKNENIDEDSVSGSAILGYRITGNEIVHNPPITGNVPENPAAVLIEEEKDEELDNSAMDWEDLTREQWSETDRLLQKIERVGSKVLQPDFLSIVDLVHVSKYNHAEETLAQKKLKAANGKKVTTGPWQIFDIPTKVTNRRCNYLASGVYVTVRQKDPLRSFISSTVDTGVKTRHHDSRGSSRTSSRASSPISSLTDSCNRDASAATNKFRKIKTRATKVKKVSTAPCNAQTKSTPSVPSATNLEVTNRRCSEENDSATVEKDNSSMEPCVTYSMVDGVPHFKVFFSSSSTSTKDSPTVSIASASSRRPASIVESEIEIIQTSPSSDHSKMKSSSITSSKSMKRPRLSQPAPNNPYKISKPNIGSPVIVSSSISSSVHDVGLSKCGKWIDAPHFNSYRTFPSVSCTSSMPLLAPKLVPPPAISTAKLPTKMTQMPKLTMGALKTVQNTNKYVPIVPKVPNIGGGSTNFVIVPFSDKNNMKRPISLLKTCPPGINNPATAGGASAGGTFLTVKNLKECLQQKKMQQQQQYKDMKVVVQKVPPPPPPAPLSTTADETKLKSIKDVPAPDAPTTISTVIVADMTA